MRIGTYEVQAHAEATTGGVLPDNRAEELAFGATEAAREYLTAEIGGESREARERARLREVRPDHDGLTVGELEEMQDWLRNGEHWAQEVPEEMLAVGDFTPYFGGLMSVELADLVAEAADGDGYKEAQDWIRDHLQRWEESWDYGRHFLLVSRTYPQDVTGELAARLSIHTNLFAWYSQDLDVFCFCMSGDGPAHSAFATLRDLLHEEAEKRLDFRLPRWRETATP
jgi:Arc/MetJ-type ribon-helix-helix transcriptional regulator